jgi:hypothetical protein
MELLYLGVQKSKNFIISCHVEMGTDPTSKMLQLLYKNKLG